jgi:hypothetical protein
MSTTARCAEETNKLAENQEKFCEECNQRGVGQGKQKYSMSVMAEASGTATAKTGRGE